MRWTGLLHGKLLNSRTPSVEFRFVSTSLRPEDRMDLQIVDTEWQGDDEASKRLYDILRALLNDWGVFLGVGLYTEALDHFLRGPDAGVYAINMETEGRPLGPQKMHVLDSRTACHVSAVRRYQQPPHSHRPALGSDFASPNPLDQLQPTYRDSQNHLQLAPRLPRSVPHSQETK